MVRPSFRRSPAISENRVLDLLHVGRDVAHEGARGVAAQEREGLAQHVLVERVAQVGHARCPTAAPRVVEK